MDITQIPADFLNADSLTTLAGLSTAVYVIVSMLRGAGLEFPTKAAALGIGLTLALIVMLTQPQPTQTDVVLAIVNGCLAALVATGGSYAVQAGVVRYYKGGIYRMADSKPMWWERW